jgi:hypothetical protein
MCVHYPGNLFGWWRFFKKKITFVLAFGVDLQTCTGGRKKEDLKENF